MSSVLTIKDRIVLFPLWLLTLLPLRMLYGLADLFFLILYYLVGYRKKVVLENLQNSFPGKTTEELLSIRRKFFRYLNDYFIESVYLMNMSLAECNRRFRMENVQLLEELAAKGKDIVVATSHYGNWEWAVNFTDYCDKFKFFGIYKPLSNKVFDRLFIHLRSRFGGIPIPMKNTLRELVASRAKKELFALYTMADQRPVMQDTHFWMKFLNQETPVITGWSRIARKFNMAVVFIDLKRVRRGYYVATYKLITESAANEEPDKLVLKYMQEVESMVRRDPPFYLWSHKRWKFKPEDFKYKKD